MDNKEKKEALEKIIAETEQIITQERETMKKSKKKRLSAHVKNYKSLLERINVNESVDIPKELLINYGLVEGPLKRVILMINT